jgi:hypothetical protein
MVAAAATDVPVTDMDPSKSRPSSQRSSSSGSLAAFLGWNCGDLELSCERFLRSGFEVKRREEWYLVGGAYI